ncbi:uncharacterized protein N7511_001877 [Penicillium nucicola]|uniref:uncharacterized protein n=1 Tax=Penicillium nucicola TaxID=1850975 RepID=UPI002545ADF6|nr:uncharacterized protein N7511_001877 [Penicillium nucicola]KAJ5769826.1 hypothetical protein N7511_001877 [Penicillium nucicola]
MATEMDQSKEDKIKDLLEDIDLHKFLYEDLLASRGDGESAAEMKATIKSLESQVARLLGESVPEEPASSKPAPTQRTQPQTAPTQSQLTPSPNPPPMPATAFPGDSRSVEPTPYRAPFPSAFSPASRQVALQSSPMSSPGSPPLESSRKRPRTLSSSSPTLRGPSKRTVPPQPDSRRFKLDDLIASQERMLAENRRTFQEMMDPEQLRLESEITETPVATLLKDIQEDFEDSERSMKKEFQMARDAEMARMLQAQENEYQAMPSPQRRPSWILPDRSHPTKVKLEPPANPFAPSPRVPGGYPSYGSDDDLQEITADSFNSRPGAPPPFRDSGFLSTLNSLHSVYPPNPFLPRNRINPGYPFQPPHIQSPYAPLSPRPLPWLDESRYLPPRGTEPFEKAFDVVRNQDEIFDDQINVEAYNENEFPEDIKNLLTGIKDINEATQADQEDMPGALRVTLMKHQTIGLNWMKAKEESNHKGGILADDMGLGKTIQAIALMVSRPFDDPERRPNLIIAPKSLMDQWRLEIERHVKPGPHKLSVLIYHGVKKPWRELNKYDVVITTYGTLTANYKTLLKAEEMATQGKDQDLIRQIKNKAGPLSPPCQWHRVIIDEAHNIKNPNAKSNAACCRLNATYRWCLTGTPMMNRLEDFQSLLGFLRIKPYSNANKFKTDFTKRIKQGWGGEDVMKQLRVLVKSVCLRRTKSSKIDGQPILQLPPKVTEKIHVLFGEKEREVYDELNANTQRTINRYLDAGTLGRNYGQVLALLLRLRQACCHPLLIKEFRTNAPAASDPAVDKIANAKLLAAAVIERIKSNDDEENGTCPVCMDSVGNATIYIPCGHHVCSECWIRIMDNAAANPAALTDDDVSPMIKCQNCRGPVDPNKLTDTISFQKVHDPSSLPESESTEDTNATKDTEDDEATASSSSESESDTEEEDTSAKKKSLSQMRIAAHRNKNERKKYLRRLEKGWFPSTKIEKTIEILQANEDRGLSEKTIIFSQFTSLLDLLEVPISRRGWNHTRFDGSMGLKERNSAVTAFTNDPNCRVMLVSLKAGNSGLNLVAASHIIMFDPFWNPYIEDQAVDRAHRIGQVREVFVHRLLIENTVEDRIVFLQDQKRELISGALDEGGTMNVSRLDARELAYLFGVRELN